MSSEISEDMNDSKPAERTLQSEVMMEYGCALEETPAVGIAIHKEDNDIKIPVKKMEIDEESTSITAAENVYDHLELSDGNSMAGTGAIGVDSTEVALSKCPTNNSEQSTIKLDDPKNKSKPTTAENVCDHLELSDGKPMTGTGCIAADSAEVALSNFPRNNGEGSIIKLEEPENDTKFKNEKNLDDPPGLSDGKPVSVTGDIGEYSAEVALSKCPTNNSEQSTKLDEPKSKTKPTTAENLDDHLELSDGKSMTGTGSIAADIAEVGLSNFPRNNGEESIIKLEKPENDTKSKTEKNLDDPPGISDGRPVSEIGAIGADSAEVSLSNCPRNNGEGSIIKLEEPENDTKSKNEKNLDDPPGLSDGKPVSGNGAIAADSAEVALSNCLPNTNKQSIIKLEEPKNETEPLTAENFLDDHLELSDGKPMTGTGCIAADIAEVALSNCPRNNGEGSIIKLEEPENDTKSKNEKNLDDPPGLSDGKPVSVTGDIGADSAEVALSNCLPNNNKQSIIKLEEPKNETKSETENNLDDQLELSDGKPMTGTEPFAAESAEVAFSKSQINNSEQTIIKLEELRNETERKTEKNLHDHLELSDEKPLTRAIGECSTEVSLSKCSSNILDEDADIFYSKECVNCECPKKHKQFVLATHFSLNYFKMSRKKYKPQYICLDCFNQALDVYEEYASIIVGKQPLKLDLVNKCYDYVEIESSDEEVTNEEIKSTMENLDFSKNDLALIEENLKDSMKNVFENIDITNQLTWAKLQLSDGLKRQDYRIGQAEKELRELEKMADAIQESLGGFLTFKCKDMPTLDFNDGSLNDEIPPAGEILRSDIMLNGKYYAVKNKPIASWVPCRVIEFVESLTGIDVGVRNYKVKFLMAQYQMVKTVTAKHMAYFDPPQVRLTIGTRVIAFFDASTLARGREKVLAQSAFYPGIIAEPLKQANKFRYLIFYDDGYTQYVQHKDVRLVCQASDKVWEDVHPASRDFIQKYVEQYSVNRPMVQTQKGQSMQTESNGTWLYARVVDIDCSLILMQFDGPKNHTEWIYRGSLRLSPVFKEYQKHLKTKDIAYYARMPRRTEPFIRYTEEMERSNTQVNQQERILARKNVNRQNSSAEVYNVHYPSQHRSQNSTSVRLLNNSTIYVDDEVNRLKGQTIHYTAKRNQPPKEWKKHECNRGCLSIVNCRLDSYSPLAKPLLSGWERMKYNKQKLRADLCIIVYRAPCGKSLRNIEEVRRYLRITDNVLNVDNFDFSPDIRCLAEYKIDHAKVEYKDISYGQEKMPIPLVNYYDNTTPPPITYAAQRIPTEGVFLNLDEEFLTGCDCEDDCSDKSKCSCWQLTIEGVRYCNPKKPIETIGYQYKRLNEHVATGIYECNSRCKCKSNCLNRVVQQSLQIKLQVFKTSNRGWGLLCTNDIPKGTFICIYAGHLLTETKANEGGIDAGDEYFADLDYIEVAEQLKEGYESDVEHSEPEEDEDATYRPDPEDDDEFRPTKYYMNRSKLKERPSRIGSLSQMNDEDSQERQVISFNPNAEMNNETLRENSVRQMFGKDEAPYIMDAKTTGNLGRYFNHSCNPNLFVQNVFVDTHDLRFPWVAFFASHNIRSGTELTWNYNYEVGVVPGKVLYCQCGAANCRIRLL